MEFDRTVQKISFMHLISHTTQKLSGSYSNCPTHLGKEKIHVWKFF